jgi:uncharacterized protein with HEPN domain
VSERDALLFAQLLAVDLDAVWSMVEQDLPALRTNVQRISGSTPGLSR